MDNFDKFRNSFNSLDLDSVKKSMTEAMEKIAPSIEILTNDVNKYNKPKSKKDIKLNGQVVSVKLTTDGQVIISFPTIDDGEVYYNNFNG